MLLLKHGLIGWHTRRTLNKSAKTRKGPRKRRRSPKKLAQRQWVDLFQEY